MNAFLLETKRLEGQLGQIEKNYRIADEQMTAQKDQQERIREQYSALEQNMSELDGQIEEIRQQQSDATLAKGRLENQIRLLEEQIRMAEGSDESLASRRQTLEREKAEKEEQKTAVRGTAGRTGRTVEDSPGSSSIWQGRPMRSWGADPGLQ